MMRHWHVGWLLAVGVLVIAGVKLLTVAVTGETAHNDGEQVFCRVRADRFTRALFGMVGTGFLAIAGFIILFDFEFFF